MHLTVDNLNKFAALAESAKTKVAAETTMTYSSDSDDEPEDAYTEIMAFFRHAVGIHYSHPMDKVEVSFRDVWPGLQFGGGGNKYFVNDISEEDMKCGMGIHTYLGVSSDDLNNLAGCDMSEFVVYPLKMGSKAFHHVGLANLDSYCDEIVVLVFAVKPQHRQFTLKCSGKCERASKRTKTDAVCDSSCLQTVLKESRIDFLGNRLKQVEFIQRMQFLFFLDLLDAFNELSAIILADTEENKKKHPCGFSLHVYESPSNKRMKEYFSNYFN